MSFGGRSKSSNTKCSNDDLVQRRRILFSVPGKVGSIALAIFELSRYFWECGSYAKYGSGRIL
jgi:hypothetical protein